MQQLRSFSPIINSNCHTLILGSMPGKISLSEVQYYAHPRNAFWHIMAAVYGAETALPYQDRLGILLKNGIALWDVIAGCQRTTSLDTDIKESSIVANDFLLLLQQYKNIRRIFFNGGKAEQSFQRYALPLLNDTQKQVPRLRLTSTSPANARFSIDDKIAIWSKALIS
jgi:TDG/mug DNA glycosylase family protein